MPAKSKITNKQLSEILKNLNLPHTGKKDELLERLGWSEFCNLDSGLFNSDSTSQGWDLKFDTVGPIIKRVPKASRIQVCKSLTEILQLGVWSWS